MYKIVVSGELSFEQDLIFSKLTSDSQIKKSFFSDRKFGEQSSDQAHLHADFALLRKEIQNGVITSDVLEILRKVCTGRELKEFMDLEVVTAIYWSKKDKIDSLAEWVEKVIEDLGSFTFNSKNQGILDTRTRAWYGVSLEDFIGKLVSQRRELKRKAKAETDPKIKEELEALQKALKLIINVLYGTLASPYFDIGNVVVADNITARARCEVWKLAKALNLSQTITDGGCYCPDEVFQLKPKLRKPSLHYFSNIKNLENHRAIKKTSLGGIQWKNVFDECVTQKKLQKEVFAKLDQLATQHLHDFWGHYGLEMKLDVEHKFESMAAKVGFFSKAHYLQKTWCDETKSWSKNVFVIRGATREPGTKENPMFQILKACIGEHDVKEITMDYQQASLLKLERWRMIQESKNTSEETKKIRPGEKFIQERRMRLGNLDKPIMTAKEFKKRSKRATKKDAVLFERYLAEGIAFLTTKMLQDDLKTINPLVTQKNKLITNKNTIIPKPIEITDIETGTNTETLELELENETEKTN